MRRGRYTFQCALGLVVLVPGLLCGSNTSAAKEEPDRQQLLWKEPLRQELARLIRQDAESMEFDAKLEPIDSTALPHDDALLMEAVVVSTARMPDLATPRETPVEEFFRTGTVAERIGRKVTTRLWMKGDRGVMLSFSW